MYFQRSILLRGSLVLSSRDPAIRRGKNAPPADDSWPTFIFPASGQDIANTFASSAFLLPSPFDFAQGVVSVSRTTPSRRLEGSRLLNTIEPRVSLPVPVLGRMALEGTHR